MYFQVVRFLVVFTGADLKALFLTTLEQVRHCSDGNNRTGAAHCNRLFAGLLHLLHF